MVEGEVSDSGDAGDDVVAAETAGELVAEEIITWVEREIPGFETGTGGDRGRVESVLELFENLGVFPVGLGLKGKEERH